MIYFVCRATTVWMMIVIFWIIVVFWRESISLPIGPNADLFILSIAIDTNTKYMTVVGFCFCNSIFRSLQHNMLQPYITNEIQDISDFVKNEMTEIDIFFSYEISCVSTIYVWFDFFMYMHILLSQIDLLLVEVAADILMTILINRYYLQKRRMDYTYV